MFADNLKKRRLQMGLSQEELARRVGYSSRSSVAKLEAGTSSATTQKLQKLAQVLDISVDELIGSGDTIPSVSPAQNETCKTVVLIQAGGKSTRNIMNVPNQFITIDDKPVIIYVLEAYEKHPAIDEIHIICAYGWESILNSYLEKFQITKVKSIITGGDTILESVRHGFHKIEKDLDPRDIVILQESTRPMVNGAMISKLLSSYATFGNSVIVRQVNELVQFQKDAGRTNYLDRNTVYSLENPEIYSAQTLKAILSQPSKQLKDDGSCCALLFYRLGIPIHFCETKSNNIKIIRQEDAYTFKVLNSLIL